MQGELTHATFHHLLPTVFVGVDGLFFATVFIARLYADAWLWKLAWVMLAAGTARLSVVIAFPIRCKGPLGAARAHRWELLYGAFTVATCSTMAMSTAYNFRHHDAPTAILCTLGTFCICAGLSSRTGLRPWIVQLAGLIMLVPLGVSAVLTLQPVLVAGSVLILFFALNHCQTVAVQYEVLVEQLRTRRRLRELSERDTLTGLFNRRHFETTLEQLCARQERFAILYIDLDRFKQVNDSLGHVVGDTLLQRCAERLHSSIRGTDLLARLGGDEFAILQSPLPEAAAAKTLATHISQCMAEMFEINGKPVSIGASVGIHIVEAGPQNPSSLLDLVDQALYRVKQAGGGGVAHTS